MTHPSTSQSSREPFPRILSRPTRRRDPRNVIG
jgi:hypothetical protein